MRLRAIRLAALQQDPQAFGTVHATCVVWPDEQWREQLRTLATFVAVDDDTDVGMVRVADAAASATSAYLISMWVAPVARRQGLGAALVDHVIAWARAEGKTHLLLSVREHNESAIALYESRGFRFNGTVTAEPPPQAHLREREYVLDLSGH